MTTLTSEEVRKIGNEIGTILLQGVHEDFQQFKKEMPDIVKTVVNEQFDSVGIDARYPYERRAEFDFLKKLKKDWEEIGDPLKSMLKDYAHDKKSRAESKQKVKNMIWVGIVGIVIVAVFGYVFGIDITRFML